MPNGQEIRIPRTQDSGLVGLRHRNKVREIPNGQVLAQGRRKGRRDSQRPLDNGIDYAGTNMTKRTLSSVRLLGHRERSIENT